MAMLYETIVPNERLTNSKIIQNEAAHIDTGATKPASIKSLLSDTVWKSLTSRREKHKLILLYKMINSLAHEYLTCTTNCW